MRKTIILIMLALVNSVVLKAQTLSVDETTIANNQRGEICIRLNNGGDYVASGFYVILPDGFTFTGNVQDVSKEHVVKTYIHDDNKVKVAVFSTNNDQLCEADSLLALQIKTPKTPGIYQGTISGIEFASNSLELLYKSNVSFNIVVDESTSVELTVPEGSDGSIYNVAGQQILQPENEVYIQEGKKRLNR